MATAAPARAVDVPVGDKQRLTLDISNTTEGGYHFDNRNSAPIDPKNPTLTPSQRVDDHYGEWLNRLQVRAFLWKFNAGLRVDSALFFGTLSRSGARDLIDKELGPFGHPSDLALENRFAEELHSRYGTLLPGNVRGVVYPSKLWVGFKNEWIEASVGDFYLHLGRGVTVSVAQFV